MTTTLPDSSPVYVRARVETPDGDVAYAYGGAVPAWLWNDPGHSSARESWKRTRRADILREFYTLDPKPRGYRVTWDSRDDFPWDGDPS